MSIQPTGAWLPMSELGESRPAEVIVELKRGGVRRFFKRAEPGEPFQLDSHGNYYSLANVVQRGRRFMVVARFEGDSIVIEPRQCPTCKGDHFLDGQKCARCARA